MSAIEIFADTSGWGNLVDPSQKHHAQAATIYRDIRRQSGKFITTNYVINELVALFTSPLRLPREKTTAFIDAMKMSAYVEIVHIDTNLDIEAWEMLKQFRDKDWSLVDCSSFVLMKQRGIVKAWTHDHHFEQAGFVRLLGDSLAVT
jgi:predicted nucleic acid-binding protein